MHVCTLRIGLGEERAIGWNLHHYKCVVVWEKDRIGLGGIPKPHTRTHPHSHTQFNTVLNTLLAG